MHLLPRFSVQLVATSALVALLACGDDVADDPTGSGGAGAADAGAGGQGPGGGSGAGGEGGGSGGHGGGDKCVSTPIAGDHCDAVAEATCSYIASCYPHISTYFGAKAECLRSHVWLCEQTLLLPGTGETAAEIKACAEKLVNATCDCAPDEVCGQGLYVGTLADGAGCEVDGQCLGGLCHRSGSYCGTCQTLVPANGACDVESPCVHDHYCDTSSGVCVPRKEPGSACLQSDECNNSTSGVTTWFEVIRGSACVQSQGCNNDDRHRCVDGICSPALGEGESCAGSNNDDACDIWQGLSCRTATSGTCQATSFSAPGGPCGDLPDDARCDFTGWCNSSLGTCEALKGLNEACKQIGDGESPKWDCLPVLSCIGGTCQPIPDITCP